MKKAFDSSPGTSNPLFKTVNKELISSIKVPFAGDKEIMIHNIKVEIIIKWNSFLRIKLWLSIHFHYMTDLAVFFL